MKKYVVIYCNIGGNIDMKRMKKNMIDVASTSTARWIPVTGL